MTLPEKILVNCDHLMCYCKKLILPKYVLVLVRHTESDWNESRRYTGWADSLLSRKGKVNAIKAGELLKGADFKFDVAFTSVLTRSTKTLDIILQEIGQTDIPIKKSWKLNQRQYGALTGLNKNEAEEKYGKTLIQIWRNSYDSPPPDMEEDHIFYKNIFKDPRYVPGPYISEFPVVESLKDVVKRSIAYWKETIYPTIKTGKNALVVAHENSIKGILKQLMNMSDDELLQMTIPHGIPIYFKLNSNFDIIDSYKYLESGMNVVQLMHIPVY